MSIDPKRFATAGKEPFLDMFRMQPNIPFDLAFSQLSELLGCIRHLTTEAEMENDRWAGSSARILSCFAKAIIEDMELGMYRSE
ncbi:DUF3077 domain-containing protein [Pseudomonas reidholzensis]|uniref:DUF3077 domain-containing protein n=1 Tax=Pseudomonas reidholzensis TaxID=1785162 RepID=UPI0039EF4380